MTLMAAPVASLKALLTNIVDYAGLFPPAKLDMARTVRNYARYLQSDECWMLGRLIVPVARLGEFEKEAADVLPGAADDEPWQISALAAPASDAAQLAKDLVAIDEFNVRHDGAAVIDTIELKAQTATEIGAALDHIPDDMFPFFEFPIDRDPRGLIAELADADAGAKVRTGGVTADAYPSAEDLARFMAACAAVDVPFKATAGLHHPLRHYSDAVKAKEFGFLNAFMAGCLMSVHEIDDHTLQQLLEEESIESFSFDVNGAAWRRLRIENDDIESARESFAVSFGSCSFDEPIEDLRSLKLL